jgi:hypothetical protein
MSIAQLLEPVLTNGLQTTNYFNGRLLTAEDLRTDQAADREKRRQLGAAIGAGVVWGFDVSLDPASTADNPVLKVTKGLAINRKGETVALQVDVGVAFRTGDVTATDDAGLFAVCSPTAPALTNPGLYILTVAPVSGLTGSAPMIELGAESVATKCASAFGVEGVRFNVVRIDLPSPATGIASDILSTAAVFDSMISGGGTNADLQTDPRLYKFRNLAAHHCFGTEKLRKASALMNPDADFSLAAQMYQEGALTNCETPLALIYWNRAGVAFVDMWAVRRAATQMTERKSWGPLTSARRAAAGLAMFYQFADTMESVTGSGFTDFQLSTLGAKNLFRFLPAAGIAPVSRVGYRGIFASAFFQQMVIRGPEFIDGAKLAELLYESFRVPPVDLEEPEFVWVYQVWQNAFQINQVQAIAGFLVFASPYLPYQATARFDASRWDYSNYNGFPMM